MAGFLHDDFLLSGETACALFHGVAERLPIVDLHNHLSPTDIAENRVFETLTDLWLEDDHYKWRAMRLAGFDERLVTGEADPWERFAAWAETVPGLVRNPLYVWTHLELRRVFGIDLPLGPRTAREIWDEANRLLPGLPARTLLARFGVSTVATTDDPCDDLSAHRLLGGGAGGAPWMIPTFRPDAAHRLLDDPPAWNAWADGLGVASDVRVDDLDSLLAALTTAHEGFVELGCRASDHGLASLPDADHDPRLADSAVRRVRSGEAPSASEQEAALLEVVMHAARLAAGQDGVMQVHLGARRDVSPRILELLGHDAGADAVDDIRQGPGLVRLLANLERGGTLPRMVLYNADPADDTLFATVAGAFSRPGATPLVQWGPPWWFNDHEDGIRRQLNQLSRTGRLAGFTGMVTDSRSLVSMTRHELFRRILCDTLGRDADAGLIPPDLDLLSAIVRGVCLDNAVTWFGL
ncbi:MAG: glucuronate isomerase [Verrucomicrobiota bacterium]